MKHAMELFFKAKVFTKVLQLQNKNMLGQEHVLKHLHHSK